MCRKTHSNYEGKEYYYLVDINSIKELDIKDYVIDAINKFLSVYYDKYTGLYIHSKKFLNRELVGFV